MIANQGVLELVNPAAAALLIADRERLIGRPIMQVFSKNAALLALFNRTLRG